MKEERNKCVMVLDETLPAGLAVNTAGVLAITLGREVGEMVGAEVVDGSGGRHSGITTVPVPVLKAGREALREIRSRAGKEDLLVVDFTDVAQKSKTYDDYERKMATASSERLSYLGVALYGDKRPINKLTGSLPLLK